MMKRFLKRAVACVLSAALISGMCLTASAFKYPSAYWKLHDAWAVAIEKQDLDQVIDLAGKTYDLLMPLGLCADVCYNLDVKCAKASWACEMKGDLDGAIKWTQRQMVFADWLNSNVRSYHDILINGAARLEHLNAATQPAIYARTTQPGKSFPGTAASTAGTWYGSTVDGSERSPHTALMYVNFGDKYSVDYWINFYKNQNPDFKKAVTSGGIVELAWNFTPENTQGALNVLSADKYIADSLKAMGKLNATVLLRVGAEMNLWGDCDPDTFIRAFRKVAQAAEQYPNIQMVFSPGEVSNRNVTIEQYYPGDEYVDWIGSSSYHNTNYAGQVPVYDFAAETYGNDAYFGWGLYDSDPMVMLRPLMRLAEEHGKPVMISECGFSYRDPATGADQTAYAVDQMNKFYSYVNMIYPQVKAVFYFNRDMQGSYELNKNSAVYEAYHSAIEANGGYMNKAGQSAENWHRLDKAELSGKVKLATYASFPGRNPVTVTYYLNDKPVATTTRAPYYYELDMDALPGGNNTLKAVATSGQFSRTTAQYDIGGAVAPAPEPTPGGPATDLPMETAGWAKDLILDAEAKGLITSRNRMDFTTRITRLQFAELAVNLIETVTGKSVPTSNRQFADTADETALKAVAAGVTAGTGDGSTFTPDGLIDRQQICTMLNAVINYVDGERGTTTLTDPSTQLSDKFVDGGAVAGWAVPFVAKLTNNGLMSGKTGDGGLRVAPGDNTSIAEAIVLIRALYNKFG